MAEIDNVELKKRSRRRLVGAAALALLAAIVLPMVMDQEPMAPVQDIQVTIPERDSDSGVVRPSPNRQASAVEPQLAPAPEEQAPGPVPADPARAAPEAGATHLPSPIIPPAKIIETAPPAKLAAAKPAEAGVKPDGHKPEQAKVDASRAGAQSLPPSPVENATRAKDILEGKTVVATAPAGAGDSFVVQIGAFADAAKAASIVSDLKKRGFAAYTEKVGAVTRVRLGPYRGREDADRAAQRVRAGGVSGTVMPR